MMYVLLKELNLNCRGMTFSSISNCMENKNFKSVGYMYYYVIIHLNQNSLESVQR